MILLLRGERRETQSPLAPTRSPSYMRLTFLDIARC